MITFAPDRKLGNGDLSLVVRDERGILFDPYNITYTIFSKQDNQTILALGPKLVPDKSAVGLYWVNRSIPSMWTGPFQIVWYLIKEEGGNEETVYEDFRVERMDLARTSHEAPSIGIALKPSLNQKVSNLVMLVRELLSDENPDRNYHFRPPTAGKTVAGFSQRVGFIWTDDTILRMLDLSIAQLNTANPQSLTNYTLANIPDNWAKAACVGAAAHCLGKEATRWAADEFSYSLNGVSLDLNKAQLYQALGADLKAEFKEWATTVSANRPMSVGLRQSKWLL